MFSFVSKHLSEHIDLTIWVLLYLITTDPYLDAMAKLKYIKY